MIEIVNHWIRQIWISAVQLLDSTSVQRQVCVGSVQLSAQVVGSSRVYLYIKCNVHLCVCPVYMSCEHRSTVHLYKFCTVVQYFCTNTLIYTYKVLCPTCMLFLP